VGDYDTAGMDKAQIGGVCDLLSRDNSVRASRTQNVPLPIDVAGLLGEAFSQMEEVWDYRDLVSAQSCGVQSLYCVMQLTTLCTASTVGWIC